MVRRVLFLIGCVLLPLQLIAEPVLEPFHLTYSATYNGMDVTAERTLKKLEDGSYQLLTSAESFFASIRESGSFSIDNNGVILGDRYQYKRGVLGSKRTEHLAYDRAAKVAIYNSKDKERRIELTQDAKPFEPLNRLTYQIQLRRDLANQCQSLEYQVINRGRLKTYRFEKIGEELLSTPLGPINTIKVRRIRDDKKRETIFWFAPELNYLLIKLWQMEEDGEKYQISLKQGQLNGQPLAPLPVKE